MTPLTKQEFLRRVFEHHGTKYTLDPDFEYTRLHDKYFVECSTHGEWAAWGHHLAQGIGCPSCASEKRELQFWTVLRDRGWLEHYDTTQVKWVRSREVIHPVCNIHKKVLNVMASSFEKGSGCVKCGHFKFVRS
jgi:hypothetical protein